MAVMMILMVVFLVVGGPGGHMGLHGANDSPSQASQSHGHGAVQSHEHRAVNPDPDEP